MVIKTAYLLFNIDISIDIYIKTETTLQSWVREKSVEILFTDSHGRTDIQFLNMYDLEHFAI